MTKPDRSQPVVVVGESDEVATLRRKLAEYAMSMDVLSRLNLANTEDAVVEGLLDLVADVCAPAVTGFSTADGNVRVRPDNPSARGAVTSAVEALTPRGDWLTREDGFVVQLRSGADVLGYLVALGVAFPAHLTEYLNLMLGCRGVMAVALRGAAAMAALLGSEQNFRELADRSGDVMWRVADGDRLVYLSPAFEQLTGWTPEHVQRDPELMRQLFSAGEDHVGGDRQSRYDVTLVTAKGRSVVLEMTRTRILGGALGTGRDVTADRHKLASLEAKATRDPLTGLSNRDHFCAELAQLLRRSDDDSGLVAVAMVDLDDFKGVNDSYGHGAGDQVLVETARRLRTSVRAEDLVGRLGGDEFVLAQYLRQTDTHELRRRLDVVLSQPVIVSRGVQVPCRASIGWADSRDHPGGPQALLTAADAAMYRVKRWR